MVPRSLTFLPGFASPELSHFSWWEPQNWVAQLLNEGTVLPAPYIQVPASQCLSGTGPWNSCCLNGSRSLHHPWQWQPESVMGCETLDRSIAGLGLSLLASKSRGSGPGSKVGFIQLAGRANELSPKSKNQRGSRYCPGVEDTASLALG